MNQFETVQPAVIERQVSTTPSQDLEAVIRMNKSDMEALQLSDRDLVEIRAESIGARLFAEARRIFPSEEEENTIVFSGLCWLNLIGRTGSSEGISVKLTKISRPYKAAHKITLRPDYLLPNKDAYEKSSLTYIHPKWIITNLDGFPVWNGCVVQVTIPQMKGMILKVSSVESVEKELRHPTLAPYIITMDTLATVLYDTRPPLIPHLSHGELKVSFSRVVADYEFFFHLVQQRLYSTQKEVENFRGYNNQDSGKMPVGGQSRNPHPKLPLFSNRSAVNIVNVDDLNQIKTEEDRCLQETEQSVLFIRKMFEDEMNISLVRDISSLTVISNLEVVTMNDAVNAIRKIPKAPSFRDRVENLTGLHMSENDDIQPQDAIKLIGNSSEDGITEITCYPSSVFTYSLKISALVPSLDACSFAIRQAIQTSLKMTRAIEEYIDVAS